MFRQYLLFLAFLIFCQTVMAVDMSEDDKRQHAFVCAGIAAASYGGMRMAHYDKWTSSLVAFSFTMLVGHIKEHTDPIYDWRDMQADGIGATAGILLPVSFDF